MYIYILYLAEFEEFTNWTGLKLAAIWGWFPKSNSRQPSFQWRHDVRSLYFVRNMYIHPEYVYYIYNAHSLLPGLSLYATRSLTSLAQYQFGAPGWSTGDFSVARLGFSRFFGFHRSHLFTLDQTISWFVYFWKPAFSLGTWHCPVVNSFHNKY